MPRKYVKKPVVIEAVQWTGFNVDEIRDFVGELALLSGEVGSFELIIYTLEGNHLASYGDFIIRGVDGEFYPCKPEIFKKTYDLVEE